MHARSRTGLVLSVLLLVAGCGDDGDGLGPDAGVNVDSRPGPITLQILDISDWHAQLDPLPGGIGGAGILATWFHQFRTQNPNTITVTAGDAFGASPPLSSLFDDVPAVDALDAMGLQVDTFGNHNFDKGIGYLQALVDRARYQLVSSNLDHLADNLKGVVSPYLILPVAGVKVAFVGITNPDAAELTGMGNLGTMTVREPSSAANLAAAQARTQGGADVVVVLAHMGASGVDANQQPIGSLLDLARLLQGVDLVIGDHTDVAVNTRVNGIPVVENRSFGRTLARIQLTFDPMARTVTGSQVDLITPTDCQVGIGDGGGCSAPLLPDETVQSELQPYRQQIAARLDAPAGVASGVYDRGANIERLREVALGDLVTDAMREKYGTQLAIVNGGALRSTLPSAYLPTDHALRRLPGATPPYAAGPPYDLVVGDTIEVLKFGNLAVTRTVSGDQLWGVLERSVYAEPLPFGGFMQVSGFSFTYDHTKPVGSRVVSVTLDNGQAIARDGTRYTLTLDDFHNAGNEGYAVLADGQGSSRDKLDAALLEYLKKHSPVSPATSGRITDLAP